MSFVRIGGLTLHYRVQGRSDAPALVLVNSLGCDARIWDEVIAILGERYRIISYDKRGHGLSDAPEGDYRLEDHVDDLEGLMDHLRIEQLALCGVSVGGQIAQAFALRHPQRLTALVLCDTAARLGSEDMWNARIAAVHAGGLEAIADAVMERWFTPAFRRDRAVDTAGWRNMLLAMPVAGYAGTCAALRDADLTDSVGAITTPTLVVCGNQDLSTPPELVLATAQLIPNSRFELIAGAGHIPSIEQSQALAALMQSFFDEVSHG